MWIAQLDYYGNQRQRNESKKCKLAVYGDAVTITKNIDNCSNRINKSVDIQEQKQGIMCIDTQTVIIEQYMIKRIQKKKDHVNTKRNQESMPVILAFLTKKSEF